MEKLEFIKMMLNRRGLSMNDKRRLMVLATKEIENNGLELTTEIATTAQTNKDEEQPHKPKDTATFLSLFNDPKGFKFLTHDFDPDSDLDYDGLMIHVRSTFKKESTQSRIPKSLYALMYTMLYGGEDKTWMDCDGVFHKENYATPTWADWSHQNPKAHLLSNEKFSATILKFRSSIRLIKPVLLDIVRKQDAKHSDLIIQTDGLEKADFYTYVRNLENGIKRILDDMSRYSSKTPNVKITFERKFGDDFSSRIIKITQIGSVSSSLDDVLVRFHGTERAGAFNEIKKVFIGYCNWSVEALWDGKPQRWNILKDSDVPEVEDLLDSNIAGFTHILTYFSK